MTNNNLDHASIKAFSFGNIDIILCKNSRVFVDQLIMGNISYSTFIYDLKM